MSGYLDDSQKTLLLCGSAVKNSIIKRPVKTEINNILLPGVIRRGEIAVAGEGLDEVVVLDEYAAALDLGVHEDVDQRKRIGTERDAWVLNVELLQLWRVAEGVVGRLPVNFNTGVKLQVAAEVNVLIRELGVDEKLGYLHSTFTVL